MITLNKIRELILKQDLELENMLRQYFEQSLNNNLLDVEAYKDKSKKQIENLLNEKRIDEAKLLIENYKQEFKGDISIYSIEAISLIYQERLEEAYTILQKGLDKDSKNVDLLYNMAYLNLLIGDISSAKYYYYECLSNSKDEKLNQEINSILKQIEESKESSKEYIFITVGINKDDQIFDKLKNESKNIVSIVHNEDLQNNKKYIDNDVTTYEVNNYENIINELIDNDDNCIIIVNDFNLEKYIRSIKDKCKIIYYTNRNLYTDKTDYINNNANLVCENLISNISDLILTYNVSVYNCKKILEDRNNIHLLNTQLDNLVDIMHLIENQDNELNLGDYISDLNVDNEYDELLYSLSINISNYDKSVDILEYMYYKYRTEEVYKMYLYLLCINQEYDKVIQLMLDSEFCEEIFKFEILYLSNMKNYSLIDFIAYLSIKAYFKIERTNSQYIEYKRACYAFETCNYLAAYNEYLQLLNNGKYIDESPMVNRNIAYLMYSNGNENYIEYYSKYQNIIEFLK